MNKKTIRKENLKKDLIIRLNKAEGQVRGIKKMIEGDIYCNDVLNQISAAREALNSISKIILENHIKNCIITKIENKDHDVLDEITITVNKLLK